MRQSARKIGFEKAVCNSGGMTCIDLGANVGEYTRKMAFRTKQVIAFEPDPWSLAESFMPILPISITSELRIQQRAQARRWFFFIGMPSSRKIPIYIRYRVPSLLISAMSAKRSLSKSGKSILLVISKISMTTLGYSRLISKARKSCYLKLYSIDWTS